MLGRIENLLSEAVEVVFSIEAGSLLRGPVGAPRARACYNESIEQHRVLWSIYSKGRKANTWLSPKIKKFWRYVRPVAVSLKFCYYIRHIL